MNQLREQNPNAYLYFWIKYQWRWNHPLFKIFHAFWHFPAWFRSWQYFLEYFRWKTHLLKEISIGIETCHNDFEQKKKWVYWRAPPSLFLPCHKGSSRNRGAAVGEVCKMCSPWAVTERQNFLLLKKKCIGV